MPTEDKVILPTMDEFRTVFNDALREGLPLRKCLDLGVVYGIGKQSQPWQVRDAFRATLTDALAKGMSFTDSLAMANDAATVKGGGEAL